MRQKKIFVVASLNCTYLYFSPLCLQQKNSLVVSFWGFNDDCWDFGEGSTRHYVCRSATCIMLEIQSKIWRYLLTYLFAKYFMNFKRITWEYYLYTRPMICLWINDDYVIGIAHFGTGWIDPADFCCTAQSPIHHLHRNCREIIILYRYTSHHILL